MVIYVSSRKLMQSMLPLKPVFAPLPPWRPLQRADMRSGFKFPHLPSVPWAPRGALCSSLPSAPCLVSFLRVQYLLSRNPQRHWLTTWARSVWDLYISCLITSSLFFVVFNYHWHLLLFCIGFRCTKWFPWYFQYPPGTTHGHYNSIDYISHAVLYIPKTILQLPICTFQL